MKTIFRIGLLFSFSTLLYSMNALSLVDMRNANYTNSWCDIESPGTGYDLRFCRTYNSRSLNSGSVGYGWCTEFETKIEPTAEGGLKLSECGAGQEIVYNPKEFSPKDKAKIIDLIIAKVKEAKKPSERELNSLRSSLETDSALRNRFALSYKVALPVKEGQTYFAAGFTSEFIELRNGQYTRTYSDGSSQKFDNQGRMLSKFDKAGNFIRLTYSKNDLQEIADSSGRKLSLKYYSNGKLRSISGPGGLSAEYSFHDNMEDLKSVKTSGKNTWSYEYDDSHNMVKATAPDGKFIAIQYDKKNDWVVAFTDEEKCIEKYSFEENEKTPKLNYWVNVNKTCGKEVTNESRYEFWYAEKSDKSLFLKRALSSVNGFETDMSYHPDFGKPTKIRRNNVTFDFDYYPSGLVKSKASNTTRIFYEYTAGSSKVTRVRQENLDEKGKVVASRQTDFRYDGRGNLTQAENSAGQKAIMTYDQKGRIATILDQAKKVVKIQYEDRFDKPAVVNRPGLGTIKVSYKNDGEIDKIQSDEGPLVATQVASSFSNLLEIISPATAEVFN